MERVERNQLLRRIQADRDAFDAIVAQLPPDRLAEPLLSGGWSVNDVLAHIAWGDREAIGMIEARAVVGSPLWDLDEDARNAAIVAESRARTTAEIVEEYRSSFSAYCAAMATLDDDDLNDPDRFAGLRERIPGWSPWRVLYDPHHYAEHGRSIAASFGLRRSDLRP